MKDQELDPKNYCGGKVPEVGNGYEYDCTSQNRETDDEVRAALLADNSPPHIKARMAEIAQQQEERAAAQHYNYYEVEGAVFRDCAGKRMELFDQKTGVFEPYTGDVSRVLWGSNPMTLDKVRPYMAVEPKED